MFGIILDGQEDCQPVGGKSRYIIFGFLCFVHPIFLSFGFWYFGHFKLRDFLSCFFRLAYLALQNVNKGYVIFS